MADFATHMGWGAVGAGLAASATYAADIVPSADLLTLTTAGVIGSVLPDIDLEKAVPSRSLFTGLGLALAFVVLFNFRATYSITELWLIWLAVFIVIRFGAYHIFHRTAIHRGIFHSLLAGLFFMALTAVIIAYSLGREPVVAWMAGLFVFFGYLIHLVLDEIYSVDITGGGERKQPMANYVFVNWGPEFQADHALAFPNLRLPGLSLDLGALGSSYLLNARSAGYLPIRSAQPHIDSGELALIKRSPRFVYPAYAVYPEDRDEEAYEPILASLKQIASAL